MRHAFEAGKSAVNTSPLISRELGSAEGEKFVLLPEDASHEEPVFESPRIRTVWPIMDTRPNTLGGMPSRIPDCSHLPRVPEDFEGREIDMHRVIVQVPRDSTNIFHIFDFASKPSFLALVLTPTPQPNPHSLAAV